MKHSSVILLCSALIGLGLIACHQPQPTPREALIQRLQDLQQRGCMFGHQDDPFYGIGWAYEPNRSDVLETCGDYPAVMGFDLGGIEMGDSKNLDSVPFDVMRREIIAHYERGGIVTISWHPRHPLTTTESVGTPWPAGTAWDVTKGAVPAILHSSEQHQLLLDWLERIRMFLCSLQTNDGKPIPVIFRPWHENNGGWFWWGAAHCTAEEYKTLYQLTYENINSSLKPSIVWSYSPNLDGSMTEERFLERYPGDEYVDLIGLDAYQWGTEDDFVRHTRANLSMLCRFGDMHHKPVALTECGYRSVPDPSWWDRVLLPILCDYPLAYALVWRNAEGGEHFGPVPGTESAEHFRAFYDAPRTLFLKDIQAIKQHRQ
ncbi:MAG: beta-mannosidase [Paludibacteraceae bacterium]|nr:beta-mannosidase [Paludibacteraceae bacterium]